MVFVVEYLRDPSDCASTCWSFVPLTEDIEGAALLARDGAADARDFLGARVFRVIDKAGAILLEEAITPKPQSS
jgi:hypothetical protein